MNDILVDDIRLDRMIIKNVSRDGSPGRYRATFEVSGRSRPKPGAENRKLRTWKSRGAN